MATKKEKTISVTELKKIIINQELILNRYIDRNILLDEIDKLK